MDLISTYADYAIGREIGESLEEREGSNIGVQLDELGFTLVNLDKVGYKEGPFIKASQAKQLFYANDPSKKEWSVVLQGISMHGIDENQDSSLNISGTSSFSTHMLNLNGENEVDDVRATCHVHIEGDDSHTYISNQYKLYVDEDPFYLMAIGKAYIVVSTIHHRIIDKDKIKVVAERDSDGSKKDV
ncbi:hypothetical protein CR513_32770, partial [Mucuna pruriens]